MLLCIINYAHDNAIAVLISAFFQTLPFLSEFEIHGLLLPTDPIDAASLCRSRRLSVSLLSFFS